MVDWTLTPGLEEIVRMKACARDLRRELIRLDQELEATLGMCELGRLDEVEQAYRRAMKPLREELRALELRLRDSWVAPRGTDCAS